jgi:hypothetical protein
VGWVVVTVVLCLILAFFSRPVRSDLDDSAVPVTVDFIDNTADSAVPIIVDGAFSSPMEEDMDAMGYNSGSLYRQFLDRSTNRFSAVVSRVQKARGNYLVASIASTRIAAGSTYAPGQEAAVVAFTLSADGVPLPVTLHVVGARNTRNGPFEYLLDTNGDGSPDIDASRYGILARAGFSSLTPGGAPYFLVEMAVPMAGKYAFRSGRMLSTFYTVEGVALSISDGEVTTGVTLVNGVGTVISASYVPIFIAIDVSTAIDLQKQGEVPVKIKALPGLNLQNIDIGSIRLRDAAVRTNFVGPNGGPGTFYTSGATVVKSNLRDTGNGQLDLTVWFTTADMKALGGFTSSSPSAVLVAKTTDGKNLSGTVAVRFSP